MYFIVLYISYMQSKLDYALAQGKKIIKSQNHTYVCRSIKQIEFYQSYRNLSYVHMYGVQVSFEPYFYLDWFGARAKKST